MLDRFTRVDYPDEMALIAAIPDEVEPHSVWPSKP